MKIQKGDSFFVKFAENSWKDSVFWTESFFVSCYVGPGGCRLTR